MGVDIGGSSIKVVELADREGVLTLVTYGEVQLGPYAGKPLGSVVQLTPKQEQEALVDVVRNWDLYMFWSGSLIVEFCKCPFQ